MRRFSFPDALVRPSSPVGAVAGKGGLPAAGPEEQVRGWPALAQPARIFAETTDGKSPKIEFNFPIGAH